MVCAVDSGVLQIIGNLSLDPPCSLCFLPPQVKLLSSTRPALSQDGSQESKSFLFKSFSFQPPVVCHCCCLKVKCHSQACVFERLGPSWRPYFGIFFGGGAHWRTCITGLLERSLEVYSLTISSCFLSTYRAGMKFEQLISLLLPCLPYHDGLYPLGYCEPKEILPLVS